MSSIRIAPGDVLVNIPAAYPDLEELEHDFDIMYFLDLCAGIEAAVLQNTLVCTGQLLGIGASRINPIVEALIESDTLTKWTVSTADRGAKAIEILSHRNARDVMAMMPRSVPAVDSDVHVSLLATGIDFAGDLGFEAETGLPLVLTAHTLPLYAKLPQVRAERQAAARVRGELAARYADFRDVLHAMRDQAYGEESIRIPPIALEVLEMANSHDELGSAMLEVRHKYASVRAHFTELDELMRSRSQSPRKLLAEQAKRRKAISKLFNSDEVDGLTVLTSFATELNDTVDLDELADGASGIDWNKVVASVVRHAEDIYWKFKLRPLHSTKQRYLDLSSKRIQDIVRHHFRHQLTARDLHAANAYAAVVATVQSPSLP